MTRGVSYTTIVKNIGKAKIERGSPDNTFVSNLTNVKQVLAKAMNEEAREDLLFKQSIERTLASGGRSDYVQICAPFELYAITRLLEPKHVVEVGVSAGVSTAYLLYGLQRNRQGGILHSIDLPEIQTEKLSTGKVRRISWAIPPGKEIWLGSANVLEAKLGLATRKMQRDITEFGERDP